MTNLELEELVSKIGRELQSRMTLRDIKSYLSRFGIDTQKPTSDVNSKWVYTKDMLRGEPASVVVKIAQELGIEISVQPQAAETIAVRAEDKTVQPPDDVLSTLPLRGDLSPLAPLLQHSVKDEWEKLKKHQIEPWIFMPVAKPFSVNDFYGKKIQYGGISFVCSPREVFWGGYIEPFLKDIITKQIEKTVGLAKAKNIELQSPLDEISVLLRNLVRDTYRLMDGIDNRLAKGGDRATSAPMRTVETLIRSMEAFVTERIEAERKMGKPHNPPEAWNRSHRLTLVSIGIAALMACGFVYINFIRRPSAAAPMEPRTAQTTSGANSPNVIGGNVTYINELPNSPNSAKSEEIPIALELRLVNVSNPRSMILNPSKRAAKDIRLGWIVWNTSSDRKATIPLVTKSLEWLKAAHRSALNEVFENSLVAPLIKRGDRLIGIASLDCPDCQPSYYVISIDYGIGGWIAPVKESAQVALGSAAAQFGTNKALKALEESVTNESRIKITDD